MEIEIVKYKKLRLITLFIEELFLVIELFNDCMLVVKKEEYCLLLF